MANLGSSHRAQACRYKAAGDVRELVEPVGIEPATYWLQTRRSPS